MWAEVRERWFTLPQTKPRRTALPYITDHTWDILAARLRARRVRDRGPTRGKCAAYESANRALEVALRRDREAWLDRLASEVEDGLSMRRLHEAFSVLRAMSNPRVRGGIPTDSQLEDAAAHMVQDRRFVWDLAQSVTAGPPLSDITSDTQLDGYTEVYTNGSCAGGNAGFGRPTLCAGSCLGVCMALRRPSGQRSRLLPSRCFGRLDPFGSLRTPRT